MTIINGIECESCGEYLWPVEKANIPAFLGRAKFDQQDLIARELKWLDEKRKIAEEMTEFWRNREMAEDEIRERVNELGKDYSWAG